MTSIDFVRAAAFVGAVPCARWTAYKDVATAGGNERGAPAIGDWLRRRGDEVPGVYRVLTTRGIVPPAFHPAGPELPADASSVMALLRDEGIVIDARGRAAQSQRFRAGEWT